jgi:hypothetical protein
MLQHGTPSYEPRRRLAKSPPLRFDPSLMPKGGSWMYKIKAEDRQWVDEFRKQPLGPHSPNLQRVLNAMRGAPQRGKYVLVCTKPHKEWALGRLPGERGKPVELLPDQVFRSLAEAEWTVFRLRWKEHTGTDLN